jgi:predicted metalloprotease with PDZ domain
MRELWRTHPDVSRPYSQDDLERALTAVTGDPEFTNAVFTRYLGRVNELDYEGLLKEAGLRLRQASSNKAWAGMTWFTFTEAGMVVTAPPMRGTPAYKSGIDRGDVILKVDNTPIKEFGDWVRALQSRKPGEHSMVRIRSSIGERIVNVVWESSPVLEIVPFEKLHEPVTPQMRALRETWLGSKALPAKEVISSTP